MKDTADIGEGCGTCLQAVWRMFHSYVFGGGASAAIDTPPDGISYRKINSSVNELYRPDAESGTVEMEIVFFHGFRVGNYNSAHIDTWMSSSEPSECWIKTWLPEEFPRARILTVSYDSSIIQDFTYGRSDLYLLAESLAQEIILSAKVGQQFATPVLLVGHCVGGLVIKQLCLHVGLDQRTLHREANQNFLENVMGVFLVATPQMGMRFNTPKNSGPLAEILQVLSIASSRLNSQFEDLRRAFYWEVHGIGESQPTQLKGLLDEKKLTVGEGTCRPYLDQFMTIPGVDHFSICRPRDTQSSTFQALSGFLDTMLLKAKLKNPPARPQKLPEDVVGFDEHLNKLGAILRRGDILEINICGMGGIGKTTLAKALFNKMSTEFEYTTFIESSSYDDTFTLETVIGSHLYRDGKKITSGNPVDLRSKSVLFVLDDVRDCLSPNEPIDIWFNEFKKSKDDESRINVGGSRLIVTSRDSDVFRRNELSNAYTYHMSLLKKEDSYKLLVKHAFPHGVRVPLTLLSYQSPNTSPINLVRTVAQKCEGLPLTLEVIGKFICGRESPQEWLDCLQSLDAGGVSDDQIDQRLWKKLKVSYDGLNDQMKQMFLDAATIFNGSPLHLAQASWNTLSPVKIRNSKVSWNMLINRSLVYGSMEDDDEKTIRMHEQLRSLGRSISESEEEKSRLRIWESIDAWRRVIMVGRADDYEQLRNIRALRFHFSELPLEIREDLQNKRPEDTHTPSVSPNGKVVQISSSLFCKMTNLKYLLLGGVDIVSGDNNIFPKSLVTLIWSSGAAFSEFPALSSPGDIMPLTVLQLRCVHLKSLNPLINSRFPHLRIVELWSARSLVEIPNNIDALESLERLSVFKCQQLEEIPGSIWNLDCLQHLVFWGCSNLRSLPDLAKPSKLKRLVLFNCSRLKHIPNSLGNLASLKVLDLHRCFNLEELPPSIGNLSSLQSLQVSGNFRKLPDFFGNHLPALTKLQFKYCEKLESLPPNTLQSCSNLEQLIILHCKKLQTMPGPDVFERLKNLKRVIVGWVGLDFWGDDLQNLMKVWQDHQVQYNVRGWNGRGLASCDLRDTDDADTISIDEDHDRLDEDTDCEFGTSDSWSSGSRMRKLITTNYGPVKGEALNHRYLALESLHKSVQEIVVTIESHDQGYSSYYWAQGTELSTHSFGELSVRNRKGIELGRIIIFQNLHAIGEWQNHHCNVVDEEFLDLVKPGHTVEVWVRSEYLAWETYVRNGSLEIVPGDTSYRTAPSISSYHPRALELGDKDHVDDESTESQTHGFQSLRSVIASYNCHNFPRRLELKKEYLRIECRWQKLQKIYVEYDSNVWIPEGDESCYNSRWGPIFSDIRADNWACSPFWAEIGVIDKNGAESGERLRVSSTMYTGFGRKRHTYLVKDESFLNRVKKGCSLVMWVKHFTDFPTCSCWTTHFQIRHAQMHLIPALEDILPPLHLNVVFPNGVGKLETSQKIQRGWCLNWMYLGYQNPFTALKCIHVVVEAHECALGSRTRNPMLISNVRELLSRLSSHEIPLLTEIVKARQVDIDSREITKVFPSMGIRGTEIPKAQSSQSGENREASESEDNSRLLRISRISQIFHFIQSVAKDLSWEELSLLINVQNGKKVDERVQDSGEVGRDSTWGELGILTAEGDQVGERIVVFCNKEYCQDESWQTHQVTVSDRTFLSSIKVGHTVALWLRSGPGWPLEPSQSKGPAAHCARYGSILLVPSV